MLQTVEQIEEYIANLILQHKDELKSLHNRITFIKRKAQEVLDIQEKKLQEKYKNLEVSTENENKFLGEFKKLSQIVLEVAEEQIYNESKKFNFEK